ncbi:hypothetical protein [Variovorax ginsengisoli]|uniref:Uncharacterized protein n=1 Tax=Variovorax ginsengisoli TaxID=363844 RepID=A0ABT8RZ68_9BURK|nr:hypothetical protein [Variovorax ginsengisoli]MDN8612791.1 hypothetical protein [Variovorax ginsengisoli]MDO1531961.1 hypothetical protein [Variovorax ginsengisoli]
MPTLRSTDAEIIERLAIGDSLVVVAPPGSSVRVYHRPDQNPDSTVTGATTTFGPYPTTKTLHMKCTAGAVSFTVPTQPPTEPPAFVISSSAPSNADGRPDGTIYIQTA